jgi:hypothetical protein
MTLNLAFIRSTQIEFDSRSQRTLKLLESINANVVVLSWDREVSDSDDLNTYRRKSRYGAGESSLPHHLNFNFWVFMKLRTIKPKVIYMADADTCLAVLTYRLFYPVDIILDEYDFLPNRITSRFLRFVIQLLDKILKKYSTLLIFPHPNRIVRHHAKSIVVPNYSGFKAPIMERIQKSIFYGGVLLPDRGLDLLLEYAVKNPDWHVTIVGFGPLQNFVSDQSKVINNLQYLGPMSHPELLIKASENEFMWALYDPTVRDNQKIASNKFSEAAELELEIITNYSIGMDYLRDKYGIARLIKYGSLSDLQETLNQESSASRNFKNFLTNEYLLQTEEGRKILQEFLERVLE